MFQPPRYDPKAQLLSFLSAPNAVTNWNSCISSVRHLVNFDNSDFSFQNIPKIDLSKLSFQSANFKEAQLQGASLIEILCWKASFLGANLERAKCANMDARNTDFCEAKLIGVSAEWANFKSALLVGADLSEANFTGTNLEGAILRDATIGTTNFKVARFDEETIFPDNYVPGPSMIWTGKGDDPRPAVAEDNGDNREIVSYDDFVTALWEKFETEKIQRALGMLQSEKFHLFADVTDDTVTGVARSQTKEERVYSCSISSSGKYGCCTQNLRHCGALRGSACKHVFLLFLVLVKKKSIEAATAYNWLITSLDHKPTIDKDLMTKTFLRYKGAEEGEVDWRPIETTPEDYYAV